MRLQLRLSCSATALRVAMAGVAFHEAEQGCLVRAGAGEPWDGVVQRVVERGLAGLECLSGIPGTVGGTPVQNVGAYGQDVARVIAEVDAFDRAARRTVTLRSSECGFGYRTSRFKGADRNRFVICGVAFRLTAGPGAATYPDVVRELGGTAGAPTLTTTANAKDLVTCTAYDATPTLHCVSSLGY